MPGTRVPGAWPELLPFHEYAVCGKCNGTDISIQYHVGDGSPNTCPKGEHHHRHCERCGYSWLEKTMT